MFNDIATDTTKYVLLQTPNITDTLVINEGERVAQLLVLPVAKVNMYPVDELSTTERNAGGFGSTGR